MSSGWLPGLHGLRVDLGQRDSRGRWVRQPAADFTCANGCLWATSGPPEVARFTAAIDQHHRPALLGPPRGAPRWRSALRR